MFKELLRNPLKTAVLEQKTRDNCGTIAGQVPSARNAALVETLSNVTLDNLELHINLTLHKPRREVSYSVREAIVFILQRRNTSGASLIGSNASILTLFEETRKAYGTGIRKPSIAEAKKILFFNGLMFAQPFHENSTQYCWWPAEIMNVKYLEVKSGQRVKPFTHKRQPETSGFCVTCSWAADHSGGLA